MNERRQSFRREPDRAVHYATQNLIAAAQAWASGPTDYHPLESALFKAIDTYQRAVEASAAHTGPPAERRTR